jgi:hypothetical protein
VTVGTSDTLVASAPPDPWTAAGSRPAAAFLAARHALSGRVHRGAARSQTVGHVSSWCDHAAASGGASPPPPLGPARSPRERCPP